MMRRKLSTKIALTIGAILLIVFTLLSIVVARLSEQATSAAIRAEFGNLAQANGKQVQAVLDCAAVQAAALQEYVLSAYDREGAAGRGSEYAGQKSMVYDAELSELGMEKEAFLIRSMWSAVLANEDLVGLGVYFEPGQFDAAVRDYTLYVNKADALGQLAESEGAYSGYGEQDYYKPAKQTLKPHFTEPYQEEGQEEGVIMITAVYPLLYRNEFRGVVLADINVGKFNKITTSSAEYETLAGSILTDDFTIVYDSQSGAYIGRNLSEFEQNPAEMQKIIDRAAAGEAFACNTIHADGRAISQFFYPVPVGDKLWWAQTVVDTSDMTKDARSLTITIVSLSFVSLFILVGIVALVIRRLLRPVHDVVSAATEIAAGNLAVNLQIKSRDELGLLAGTFLEMSHQLRAIIQDIGYLLNEMAGGNFRVNTEYEEKYIGQYREILLAVRGLNRTLSSTLTEIDAAAAQVSAGADQMSTGAQAISQGAAEQASSVEELTAVITDISFKIKENAEDARQASLLSRQSQQEVLASSGHMQQLMAAMEEITGTSNEIQTIIKAIDDIAFQTNILALNAAVEAARAGAAGKGFAVVADEVRNLAGKSAQAAHSTTELIERTLRAIENGSALADKAGSSLRAVVDKTEAVHDKIEHIAEVSDEQSGAVTQLAAGIEQVSAVIQRNSATAEESAAASQELSGQAHRLKHTVSQFQLRESDALAWR